MALGFLGGVVLGVFRQVAMGACLGDRFDDSRTLFLLTPAQFFLQLDETALSHRYLFNHFIPSFSPRRPGSRLRERKRKRSPERNPRNRRKRLNGPYSRLRRPKASFFAAGGLSPTEAGTITPRCGLPLIAGGVQAAAVGCA
nr:hypothetical protein SHINE37_42475 [Rhizobiaceae bacterium]